MKSWIRIIFLLLATITLLSLILSACGPIDGTGGDKDPSNENGNDLDNDKDKNKNKDKDKPDDPNKITICHKTGSAKNPYVELSVAKNATTDGHATHDGDIIPIPESGCPTE
ncbi:MAG TPA: hypothetical protein DCX53_07055 [Anaerolineae bacterium]|nr:hypothetical protein [Anaerolineae bacterium]